MEIRIKDATLHCGEEDKLELGGYINVTERQSEMLFSKKRNKWFKETMKKGVFQRAINKASEIPLLLEHDWSKKLATTSNGSLELFEDNIGLRFKAEIKNQDVYDKVKAGEINACSFGFKALHENIEGVNQRMEKRYVDEIELLEVSLVQNPAYLGSLVETRAMLEEEIERIEGINNDLTKDSPATGMEQRKKEDKDKVADKQESEDKKDDSVQDKNSENSENKSEDEVNENSEEDNKEASNNEVDENSEDDKKKKESKNSTEDNSQNKLSENSENSKEQKKDKSKEKRDLGTDPVTELLTKEQISQIVEELVASKMQEIQIAEQQEDEANKVLAEVKDFHRDVENEIEADCMRHSVEVMKLRTELLRLKQLKKMN